MEAKRQLDTVAYLKEQKQWSFSMLHQEYLCQMMFHYAAATGKHEYNHAIHCARWEPSVE